MSSIQPTDITMKLKRPARWEGWIPTYTGNGFNLLSPQPDDIRIEDLARGVAYKFRYSGQVSPITVAEHSVLVSTIIEILWPESKKMLAGLMHDACQAYTQDIQTPVRKFIKVELPHGEVVSWNILEAKLNQAIAKHLGLESRYWGAPEVKAANILAVALEKQQCPVLRRSGNWGLPSVPEQVAHLRLEFQTPEQAEKSFLERFQRLTAS